MVHTPLQPDIEVLRATADLPPSVIRVADHVAVTVGGRPGRMHSLVQGTIERMAELAISGELSDDAVHITVLVDPPGWWSVDDGDDERWIVVRSSIDDEQLLDDLSRGADAVLGPTTATVELPAAVRAVASGRSWLSPDLTRAVITAFRAQQTPAWADAPVWGGGARQGLGRVRQDSAPASRRAPRHPLGRL